jgi:hypothetical protein
MTCTELAPDLVAHALGQLSPEEAARVETHLAECAPCRQELAATKSLFGAAREVAAPELSAGAEDRLMAAIRAERASGPVADVPVPTARRRGPSVILKALVPLAAAAGLFVAVHFAGRAPQAEVIDGEGLLRPMERPESALRGKFDFREGDEIAAANTFTVRLQQAPGKAAGGASAAGPAPGVVEIKLLPMAHLRRSGGSEIELTGGAVEIAAGPLAEPFTIRAGRGAGYAVIRGTRFLATTADDRLVVVVREGLVELGRKDGPTERLEAGEQGLVDSERLLKRPADARGNGDSFLTPRIALEPGEAPLSFHAVLTVGEGGPVSIRPFDDADPRFVLEFRHRDGLVREIKLQRTMLVGAAAGSEPVRLAPDAPYRLDFSLAGIGLEAGRATLAVRYMSYRHRGDGADWLGVVESDPLPIEVPGK